MDLLNDNELPEDIPDDAFCAFGENIDACQFEIGAPIIKVVKRRQVVIGVATNAGFNCGNLRSFGTFTRIANYRVWIETAKNELKKNKIAN